MLDEAKWVLAENHYGRKKQAWRDAGRVYFLEAVGLGCFKIGWSATVHERVRTLRQRFRVPLAVHAIVPGSFRAEAWAKRRFRHLRIVGEWFYAAPELLDYIEKCNRLARLPEYDEKE